MGLNNDRIASINVHIRIYFEGCMDFSCPEEGIDILRNNTDNQLDATVTVY